MALLELHDVEAAYGRIQILHKVSLYVDHQEVVCVIVIGTYYGGTLIVPVCF